MSRVTYETGLKCKRCGNISITCRRAGSRKLCQNCGAHIMDCDPRTLEAKVTENADIISVKVTHKLFSYTLEEV